MREYRLQWQDELVYFWHLGISSSEPCLILPVRSELACQPSTDAKADDTD